MVVKMHELAIHLAVQRGFRLCEPDIFVGDSNNTISFLEGTAKFKSRNVSAWLSGIRESMATMDREVEFLLVPRAMNGEADRLATRATCTSEPEWTIYQTLTGGEQTDDPVNRFREELTTDLRRACNLIATRQVLPKNCCGPIDG